MPIHKKKAAIRQKALKERLKFNKKTLQNLSKKICKNFENTPQFKKSKSILFYVPIKNEVDIFPLIKKYLNKKTVTLPYLNGKNCITPKKINSLKDIEKRKFGIMEPKNECENVPLKKLDIIIVPGIVFDKKGHRLGFGFGCYDKFLKKTKGLKAGLAYSFQIFEELPKEKHDEKVDMLINEKEVIMLSH